MHLIDCVASTTAANVVDRCCVVHQASLLCELFVEAEHCPFLLTVDVTSTATTRREQGVRWWSSKLDERCWSSRIGARSNVLWVDSSDVSCAAAAGMVVVAGRNGGVWLGDLVGWHSGFGFTNLLLEKFEEPLVLM
jgi:hypothetical protein